MLLLPVVWPGDPVRGQALGRGVLPAAGHEAPARFPCGPEAPRAWCAELHAFGWLDDLRAIDASAAMLKARALLHDWAGIEGDEICWDPEIAARRALALMRNGAFLAGEDGELRALITRILGQHRLFFERLVRFDLEAQDPIEIVAALARLQLASGVAQAESSLGALAGSLAVQVHADGGHVSRCPSRQHEVFAALVETRAHLLAIGAQVPQPLQNAIDRMAPMLRFFRHGDGGLALFNGAGEGRSDALDTCLSASEASGRAPDSAPHSGFERINGGRAMLLVDTGKPSALGPSPHAGTLGFEMSIGRERLIVNCGAHPDPASPWRQALRATAAHSTLVLADTNSSEVLGEDRIGQGPWHVVVERGTGERLVGLKVGHDGYRKRFGVVHRRRLLLDHEGEELQGADLLAGEARAGYALRFHLHPSVQVSPQQDGKGALLRLPSGRGWRFRAGVEVRLEPSVYLGGGEVRPTTQLVISGEMAGAPSRIDWALTAEHRPEPKRGAGRADTRQSGIFVEEM